MVSARIRKAAEWRQPEREGILPCRCHFFVLLLLEKTTYMTEFEKMRASLQYSFEDEAVLKSTSRANELCARISQLTLSSPEYRELVQALIPCLPASSVIVPPFHCDHGHGISIGEHTFINYDCIMLDGGYIKIGAHCKIGPRCQFFTPQHPIDYQERMKPVETCHPITIGNNCWLGGGVTVCPGVTIGDRCVIAAGSVVIRDIPSDSLVAGNPAVVKRKL